MDNNSTELSTGNHPEESKIGVVRVTGLAPNLDPIEDIPHSEVFGAPDTPKIQVSPRAVSFDSEQAPILASWYQNPPLQDGLLTVNGLYQEIKDTVIAYHLKHNDAFYSQYPELLILKKGEDPSTWSTEYLRINHKKFDRRLAHHIWHYHNACCMLIGALCNMCLLAQVQGDGKFNDLGEAFKIGRINNILKRYASFFKPVYLEDYFIHYSRFATGYTVYDAVIAAFPLWVTDVLGNRGFGSFNITEMFNGAKANARDTTQVDASSVDYDDYEQLIRNMEIVRSEFIRDDIKKDGNGKWKHANAVAQFVQDVTEDMSSDLSKYRHTTPSMTKPENASTVTAESNAISVTAIADSAEESVYLGNISAKVGSNQWVTHDNLINRVWDSVNYWLEYVEKYFQKFAQPTSQMVRFCQEHKWLDTKTTTSSTIFTKIKDQALKQPFDLESIRELQIYKRDNSVTTATQIRWMPIVDDSVNESAYDADFDRNYDRYQVDEDDPVGIVLHARQFPSLSPEIFHDLGTRSDDGVNEPCVVNAITSGSPQVDTSTAEPLYPVHGILGKYASYLDYASSSHMDAEETSVDIVCLDSKVAETFIRKANGIVLQETMTCPKAFRAPLIDNTDPFQCGFNVVFYFGSRTETEFERFFKDPSRYRRDTSDVDLPGEYESSSGTVPTSPSWYYDSNTNKIQQRAIFNPDWLETNRYLFLFVGDSLWCQPEVIAMQAGAGNYLEAYQRGAQEPAQSNLSRDLTSLRSALSSLNTAQTSGDPLYIDARDDTNVSRFDVFARATIGAWATNKLYSLQGDNTTTSSALVEYMFSNWENISTSRFATALFNPQYGAVDIRKFDSPYIGAAMLLGLATAQRANESTNDPEFKVSSLRLGETSTSVYTIGNNVAKPAYDSYTSVAQFLLWPIDQIRMKKVLRSGRRLFVTNNHVEFSGFSGAAKTALALLSRSKVMYSGSEDTFYLNNVPKDKMGWKADMPELGKGSAIQYGNLITPPVFREKPITNRAHFTKFHTHEIKTQSAEAEQGYTAATKKGGAKGGSDKMDKFSLNTGRPDKAENKSGSGKSGRKGGSKGTPSTKPGSDKNLKTGADQFPAANPLTPGQEIAATVNQNASDSVS